jgi:hypothetical protein
VEVATGPSTIPALVARQAAPLEIGEAGLQERSRLSFTTRSVIREEIPIRLGGIHGIGIRNSCDALQKEMAV